MKKQLKLMARNFMDPNGLVLQQGSSLVAVGLSAAQWSGRILCAAQWRHRQLRHSLYRLLHVYPGL